MIIGRAALETAETGFQVLFLQSAGAVSQTYRDWAHRIEARDLSEVILLPEGMGEMYSRGGSPASRAAVIRDVTIAADAKINKFTVPVSHILADRLDIWNRQAQLMGAAAGAYPNRLVVDLMADGFTELGPDGIAFFSDSHPVDGGVQSNLVSGALDVDTFEEALSKLQSMTDYYGRPLELGELGLRPRLVVGPSNRAMARRLVASQNDDAGAGNPNYDEADIEVSQRLIGAREDYWFLGYPKGPVMPFVITVLEDANLQMVTDPKDPEVRDRDQCPVWASGRYGKGYGYYHLMVGSAG